jgi:hypothetical protein
MKCLLATSSRSLRGERQYRYGKRPPRQKHSGPRQLVILPKGRLGLSELWTRPGAFGRRLKTAHRVLREEHLK